MSSPEEEIARIARGLSPEGRQALVTHARFLEQLQAVGVPKTSEAQVRELKRPPRSVAGPVYWCGLGIAEGIFIWMTCTSVWEIMSGTSILRHVMGALFAAAGALAFLANTAWVREAWKRVPETLGASERWEAYRTLRWRLWRPYLICVFLPIGVGVFLGAYF